MLFVRTWILLTLLLCIGGCIMSVTGEDDCITPAICDNGTSSWIKLQSAAKNNCAELLNDKQEKFQATIKALNDRVAQLNRTLQEVINLRGITTSAAVHGCPGFLWNGACFQLNVTVPERLIDYPEAAQICSEQGTLPANVYSDSHHEIMMAYLRSMLPQNQTGMRTWIGMTYNTTTSTLFLNNGTATSYGGKWYSGAPNPSQTKSHMLVSVKMKISSVYQGILNENPKTTAGGILCENVK